ncbi:MAG: CRISPR-associated endoribonuclease Cas6 [Thermoflexus sp.]|uniref:CRISPR-associated endoribonuclease Cas6 n=2 Tax=Thermoflexus sp. TaxID=1969742 RepID=UPI0025D8146B|nr:CRISPR-associated endoribonuclease Cas6 [Thermoflexus sp.]MCS6964412.1 CRISPR-associated endoribonuclease Cas6 [Thermoflexus sp.]
MRLKIQLRLLRSGQLPWSYPEWLRGLAYTAMARGLPQVAHQLHEEGWSHPEGRRYKPLTYSWLHGLRPNGSGLWAEGTVTWWASSPIPAVVEALALGLLLEPEVRLGPYPVMVERVEVESAPDFRETMTFTALSPITISTGERRGDGRLVKRYLSPEEAAFGRALAENLRRKAAAFYGRELRGELEIQPHPPYRSKLVRIHDTDIRGWLFSFTVSGDPELIRLGYEAGFGEHTASGFGMVRIYAHKPSAEAEI